MEYHDIFSLEPGELGCMTLAKHGIWAVDDEPFKERIWRIPLPMVEEVRAHMKEMLEVGAIHPSQFWEKTVPACQLLFSHYCVAQKNASVSITTLLTYMIDCVKPSRKCKCSPHLRLKGRGDTIIARPMPFHWNQVTWSWQKLMPTKGGERWKTSGRRKHVKWNARWLKASLHTPWRTRRPDAHKSSNGIDFFSSPP